MLIESGESLAEVVPESHGPNRANDFRNLEDQVMQFLAFRGSQLTTPQFQRSGSHLVGNDLVLLSIGQVRQRSKLLLRCDTACCQDLGAIDLRRDFGMRIGGFLSQIACLADRCLKLVSMGLQPVGQPIPQRFVSQQFRSAPGVADRLRRTRKHFGAHSIPSEQRWEIGSSHGRQRTISPSDQLYSLL
jgi:hypothetical protein